MPTIPAAQAAAWFDAHVPGCDYNQMDCSGALVALYKAYGLSIYHGSNRIIRCHAARVIPELSQGDLKVGMAVLKYRTSLDKLSAAYKPGGMYYDDALPYDYYHIGLVTHVNPLRIVHSTPPRGKADTTQGDWRVGIYLSDIDYGDDDMAAISVCKVMGGRLALRSSPQSLNNNRIRWVEEGERVSILEQTAPQGWAYVTYNGQTGYMMTQYLEDVEDEGDGSPQAPATITLTLPREAAQALYEALGKGL